jgi:hypothetical protein
MKIGKDELDRCNGKQFGKRSDDRRTSWSFHDDKQIVKQRPKCSVKCSFQKQKQKQKHQYGIICIVLGLYN